MQMLLLIHFVTLSDIPVSQNNLYQVVLYHLTHTHIQLTAQSTKQADG